MKLIEKHLVLKNSVTSKISKLFKMSVESKEVKGCFVLCQVTLNLLFFAITFTTFLEIEFDFIFYVRYRSVEISPNIGRCSTICLFRCASNS